MPTSTTRVFETVQVLHSSTLVLRINSEPEYNRYLLSNLTQQIKSLITIKTSRKKKNYERKKSFFPTKHKISLASCLESSITRKLHQVLNLLQFIGRNKQQRADVSVVKNGSCMPNYPLSYLALISPIIIISKQSLKRTFLTFKYILYLFQINVNLTYKIISD